MTIKLFLGPRAKRSLQSKTNTYLDKGQLISKANCKAVNSSKKRTNEFVFTTMRRVFVLFRKKLKTPKGHFEIIGPLS